MRCKSRRTCSLPFSLVSHKRFYSVVSCNFCAANGAAVVENTVLQPPTIRERAPPIIGRLEQREAKGGMIDYLAAPAAIAWGSRQPRWLLILSSMPCRAIIGLLALSYPSRQGRMPNPSLSAGVWRGF